MYDLNALEIERMSKVRKFNVSCMPTVPQDQQMPAINLGDLIEVKYELSRTQQTFATFQGKTSRGTLERSQGTVSTSEEGG